MKSVKDKMYNYEVAPPNESWQTILSVLKQADNTNIQYLQKRKRAYYQSLAAAAVIILIFSAAIQLSNSQKGSYQIAATLPAKKDRFLSNDKISAPQDRKSEGNLPGESSGNKEADEAFINKYITISGPEGQPVKISSKVASLIISSDNRHPPNPVWNNKVKKWQNIMKTNFLAPATANFLDIVDLTYALNNNR